LVQKFGVTVRLPEELYMHLKQLAEREERSMSYLMEKPVEQYLQNNQPSQLALKLEGKND